ncbi:MAG: protein phosphatase 2C domain-containing protein [bacterium]
MTGTFGVVSNLNDDRRYGRIIVADGTNVPFLYDDYEDKDVPPTIWQAVGFEVVPHRWDSTRQVAKKVRPTVGLPTQVGQVSLVRGSHGFVSITNGDGVFFLTQIAPGLKPGDTVICTAVPGRDNHLFALTVAKTEAVAGMECPAFSQAKELQPRCRRIAARSPPSGSLIAAATKGGNRHGKDVNEDAFLVQPLIGGDAWLLIIADGISRTENAWWASDKCIELIWRSLPDIEQQLIQNRGNEQKIVSAWLDQIHRDFLHERNSQPTDFQQSSSTLTMALVRGRDVFSAHCGDSRLYVLNSKAGGAELKGVFSADLETQRGVTRSHRVGLRSHIAAKGADWNPLSDQRVIPENGLLLLCSDGVIARDHDLKGAKSKELTNLLSVHGDIQHAVTAALDRIQAAGENDDLTLIVFRPKG